MKQNQINKHTQKLINYIEYYKYDLEIRNKYFKLTSRNFIHHILKQIIQNNQIIEYTNYKEYNSEKIKYVTTTNNLRLEYDETTHIGIVRSEVVDEIKQMIKIIERKMLTVTDMGTIGNKQTFYNAQLYNNLTLEQQKMYETHTKQFNIEDDQLLIPNEKFSKDDMEKNFIQQYNVKFIYNPSIPLQNYYDINGLIIQHVIINVVDIKDETQQYPILTTANCSKCGVENTISIWLLNNSLIKCGEIDENGKMCKGFYTPQQRSITAKDIFEYKIVFCSPTKSEDKIFDTTDHYSYQSFKPLHTGIYYAQVLQYKTKEHDGFILSTAKYSTKYDTIIPSKQKYIEPEQSKNQPNQQNQQNQLTTAHNDLEIVKLYHQIISFFQTELQYKLTNQGFLITLSIITQLLTKMFDYSNSIHTFFIGDKGLGKSFLMEIIPHFFFHDIAPIENAGDLSRARYVGGCVRVNSNKVMKGLLPTYDVVRLDEYANVFYKLKQGWGARDIHKLSKLYLLSPYMTVGKGEGGRFPRKGVIIAAANFLSEYMKWYKELLKENYNNILQQQTNNQYELFDEQMPIYKNINYYNELPQLKKAHMITRTSMEQLRLHYMLPCELPDLDRFLFVYLIEDSSEKEKKLDFRDDKSISSEKLLQMVEYIIDVDMFQKNINDNYPPITIDQQFMDDIKNFFNNELIKINPNFILTSHQRDNYIAVAKTIARLEQTNNFNENVKKTLTLLFKFVNTPISKETLDSGLDVVQQYEKTQQEIDEGEEIW